MKKVIMALCLIWSLAFVSCENWLDVKPRQKSNGMYFLKRSRDSRMLYWDVIVRCQSVVFTVGK